MSTFFQGLLVKFLMKFFGINDFLDRVIEKIIDRILGKRERQSLSKDTNTEQEVSLKGGNQ